MEKIYNKHSSFFLGFSFFFGIALNFLFSFLYGYNYENHLAENSLIIFICFFLILSIGISHGALDNLKGNKVLKIYKIKEKYLFYIIYILVASIVIFLWILFPSFTLVIFLLLASYHFGKEDTCSFSGEEIEIKKSKMDEFFLLIKGSLIILAPLVFHLDATLKIFETLYINEQVISFLKNNSWFIKIFFGISVLSNFYFFSERMGGVNYHSIFDVASILWLNWSLPPLIAFTLYFCFLHSIRHSISLINILDKKNFVRGTKTFIKKALPLTMITGILYLIAIFFLTNSYSLDSAILKVIFIGLASLTFPHILLEYLIEKNEKRT